MLLQAESKKQGNNLELGGTNEEKVFLHGNVKSLGAEKTLQVQDMAVFLNRENNVMVGRRAHFEVHTQEAQWLCG